MRTAPCLGLRLGLTLHESVLRRKVQRLATEYPSPGAVSVEDWLMDVAWSRGADVVVRTIHNRDGFIPPSRAVLSNEDLVVAICQLQAEDRPQMLRLAAQLISAGAVDASRLAFYAKRERVTRILAELARQALRVEPDHAVWRALARGIGRQNRLRDSLLHWTRLAEPIMRQHAPNAERWVLRR